MNAVVASGTSAAEFAGGFDTAWLDFTKGLGAPVGAVLAGSGELIDEAWRWKQQMGGAFRQSGIVAAGCLYALDHHVERLADDHENARVLAEGLAELGCEVDPAGDEHRHLQRAATDSWTGWRAHGVELSGTPDGRVRAVTHLDVDRAGIVAALEAARGLAATLTRRGEGLLLVWKGPAFGHSRSHSMVATKRRFNPNLQKVRIDVGGPPGASTSARVA